jgi:hypothetical protein
MRMTMISARPMAATLLVSNPEVASGAWSQSGQRSESALSYHWPILFVGGSASILLFPKALEPIGGEFGVADGVLDILMPEPMLQGSRVDTVVGELVAACVSQHVRVNGKGHAGRLPYSAKQLAKTCGGHRPLALGGEDIRRCRHLLALEPAQLPNLCAAQVVHARPAVLEPADVHKPLLEIELIPAERTQLPYPEHVPVADEDHRGVAMTVAAIPTPRRLH